ncbi:hypothetical protein BDZ97DRAFT_1335792 [Flammula alnicola]|nr:hypothetical protein BDZ97DRAFT_1335792 [Flammula alnicola]
MPVPMRTAFQKAEAKYNVTTEFPSLGLHAAAATGNVGLVEYALNNGQPINSVLDGVLPLHAACAGGNVQVVKVLIDHGADVNAPRLPRKYSLDKNRDTSAPIVGTSGSTPLHFAAANGNTEVVSLLLLHGAHADRPDKHGITPEMLAHQNGWVECGKVLTDWIVNKDRDLREREGGQSTGYPGHEYPDARGSSSPPPRKRIHVKQSIDTALNMLKTPDLKTTHSTHALTPPASPQKPFGEYTFYPVDQASISPINPGSRRPSLPHILQPSSDDTQQLRKASPAAATEGSRQRRPRSAGTGADRTPEPEALYPVYGRGGSGRKLSNKYSLLSIFKKAHSGDSDGVNTSDSSPAVPGSTVTLPLPSSRSAQMSSVDLAGPSGMPSSVPTGHRLGLQHRGSDASTKGRFTPQSQSHTPNVPPLPRKPSGNLQTPPRTTVPLAVELHLALAQQQHRTKGNAPSHIDIPGDDSEKAKLSSPLAKLNAMLLPSNNRHRSGSSSSMPPPETHPAQDEDVGSAYNATPDAETGKPSPSPRPGILRAHNRTSSSGQGSPLISRTLRFDSTSSNQGSERKGRDSPRPTPGVLRSYHSAGSLTKMNMQTNAENAEVQPPAEPTTDTNVAEKQTGGEEADGDNEEYYGQPIQGLESSIVGGPNVPSVLLQRQRGLSFASSSDSSLSPILSNENANDPTMAVLNADFPFSINRPPSLQSEERAEDVILSPGHLDVPISSSDMRNRGDSLSSNSTADSRGSNMLMSDATSGSGMSVTVVTPGIESALTLPLESSKSAEHIRTQELPQIDFEESLSAPATLSSNVLGLNERRSRTPLDIDITSISSYAQAEALVQRARQEVLEVANANPQDISPLPSGAGRTPLSARLAAYGESLALERKLREQKEDESFWKDRIHEPMPPMPSANSSTGKLVSPASPPRYDLPRQKSRDGVERQLSLENRAGAPRTKKRAKDPRRPSTADGLSSTRQDFFFTDRTASHQSSRSASTANYASAPLTDGANDQSSQLQNNYKSTPSNASGEASLNSDFGRPTTRARTPILSPDESLSRINSSDDVDTETDSALTLHRVSTAPLSPTVRAKREQVRSANKLTKMGIPIADQAAAAIRTAPPTPPTGGNKRFGLKSIMQTFKGKA